MKRLTKATGRVVAAVVASGVAVGIALTVGVAVGSNSGAPSPQTTPTTQTPSNVAPSVSADLASAYGFLAAGSSTAMPTTLASDVEGFGVTPSLGREAGSFGALHLWLVPGDSGSCLELDDGGSACGPNTVAEQQGLWLMLKPVSGAAPTWYGIVPDTATVSGDAASASVSKSGNAVMVQPRASTAGRFTIHTPNGATVDMTVPAATGQPQ